MDLKNTLSTPGWRRTLFIRRFIAALLVATAALVTAHSLLSTDPQVVIIQREVPAGSAITAADIELASVPESFVPDNALVDPEAVIGLVAASTLSTGEIATSPRFLGAELTNSLVGNVSKNFPEEEVNMVPLKLADPSVIPLLHHGDTISVVSQVPESGQARTIAAGGKVILVSEAEQSTILIALPKSIAEEVAATSLTSPLAVVLSGERAG
ncbi:SAF domain-containing protein [Corynebacterium callunae]|uniref:SAF domain-containing protein n=1 Tax=Corynebacterium callunae TaxID=1721 RepID=UPI003981E253